MATTSKEKFDAAVRVIHSLPKDGPFQPSYDMMLTFYGLYKQATEGNCTKPKPWSWDIVAKKKWDAWSKLGSMASEEAMDLYVEELKKSISKSTDKWKTMGDKEKRIVEAMPQEKPVRDFMETIGVFYELIDEESPFANEKRSYDESKPQDKVLAADIDLENLNDMNHSLVVDPMLKHMIKQNATKMNGVPHRGQDGYIDDQHTESALTLMDSERENWDVISSQNHYQNNKINGDVNINGYHGDEDQSDSNDKDVQVQGHTNENSETVYDNIKHPINGDVVVEEQTNDKIPITDKVTSDSESEEEFCDTSDQPSAEDIEKMSLEQQMSTPLKGNNGRQGNRPKNRVHFSDNPSLRTDSVNPQQVLSPIPQRLQQRTEMSLSRNFPFGLDFTQNSPHDSMIVHGPSHDSLNMTGFSEIGHSTENSNSSSQSNSFTNVNLPESSENYQTRGGGQISPPGGSSGGRVPSQGPFGSQGFRQDQGYGYYEGQPIERGQGSGGSGGRDPYYPHVYGSINEQIAVTLLRLQQDMHSVLVRLDNLEARHKAKNEQENSLWSTKWWPFPTLTGRTFLFVLIWPILVHWFLNRRRRNR